MIREVVQCEECGVGGLDPVEDVCGDWIGTEVSGVVSARRCPSTNISPSGVSRAIRASA